MIELIYKKNNPHFWGKININIYFKNAFTYSINGYNLSEDNIKTPISSASEKTVKIP